MTDADRARLRDILDDTADRLDLGNSGAILTTETLQFMAHLSVWRWHGSYTDATPAVLADLKAVAAALAELPLDGVTRAQAAALIREARARRPQPNRLLAEPATVTLCAADRAATVDPLTGPEVHGAARDLLASARGHGNEQATTR
ncbi:hypothetical protein ACIGW8_22165 [Streptomyces sioyaensis]|uniref:hypothetical protein n=1 Tax=Streptomyces sioyaensis TaxID=67364 RepID=UPI0037CD51BA